MKKIIILILLVFIVCIKLSSKEKQLADYWLAYMNHIEARLIILESKTDFILKNNRVFSYGMVYSTTTWYDRWKMQEGGNNDRKEE